MGVRVSVIVPFVREWPQVAFTIRSVHEALKGISHEVIAVDNLMPDMVEDRGSKNVKGMANEWASRGDPWLKYFHYTDKLSHWQCKNYGMEHAKGDIYWFIDSHCIAPFGALRALQYYEENYKALNGSLHMPLTYHILEPKQLMYKAVVEVKKSDYHYVFHTFSPARYSPKSIVEVPAMSTCGMLIHRKYMDLLGMWPEELGIYGGGENFINFTSAVLGLKKWVWVGDSLCHHGDKRGYAWNHYDQQRNRAIATYMFGGERVLTNWINNKARLTAQSGRKAKRSILETCRNHRDWIKAGQVCEIEEWVDEWKDNELLVGDY
jgi:glycosyltransferase involved in cell wall biosynthesis